VTDARTDRPWESLPPDLHDVLAPQLAELGDEIIAAIRAEVPAYARPLTGTFGENVRRGVTEALGQFVTMARAPAGGRGAGREIYVALGRGEARDGRTLEALLAAYRVGARIAWRRLSKAGLDAGLPPETLVLLAESIFAYIDELSAESAEGYAREQAERAGESEARRTAVVALVLGPQPPDPTALADVAEAAGWPVPARLAVVAWRPVDGRRPASRLPLGSIAAPHDELLVALVPDPGAPGRRAELARALGRTAAGLGTTVAVERARRSLRRATAALALAEEHGRRGLVAADEHRIELLCRADRSLVSEIGDERLAPLEGETERSRARLEETLLAWLRRHGSVPEAAADLHVHPQTVRYRMTRLRELLGPALDDPDARFELEAALRLLTTR
jgi:PucR C-terminal helix-turn-helix domain/GGDEF-like domain